MTKKQKTSSAEAIETISRELKNDSGYYIAWAANIAMAFYDCERWYRERNKIKRLRHKDIAQIANEAAEYFLRLCFKVDPPKGCREQNGKAA